jgi:sugar lactone lactonase YvrE
MRLLILAVCLHAISLSALAAEPLVDESASLETLETDFGLADGPAWDGKDTLYVPDVKGQKLFAWQPESRKRVVVLENAGRISASYYRNGRLHLADNGESKISLLAEGTKKAIADLAPAKPNDLVVDAAGGVYCTLTKEGQVAYIGPDGTKQIAVEGIETPNGIVLSPDERTLYVSAYAPKQIWAYAVTGPGKTSGGRMLAAMDDGEAKGADGMTIDRDGNIYCAGATDIWIWNPAGDLLHKIPCPTRPINCTFGDADLKSLYITGFGGLYRQRMNAAGVRR